MGRKQGCRFRVDPTSGRFAQARGAVARAVRNADLRLRDALVVSTRNRFHPHHRVDAPVAVSSSPLSLWSGCLRGSRGLISGSISNVVSRCRGRPRGLTPGLDRACLYPEWSVSAQKTTKSGSIWIPPMSFVSRNAKLSVVACETRCPAKRRTEMNGWRGIKQSLPEKGRVRRWSCSASA